MIKFDVFLSVREKSKRYKSQKAFIQQKGFLLFATNNLYYLSLLTIRDGTKRKIKIEEGMTLQDELKKAGITESDIFQMQLVIQDDKI
ncbi:hypothetical protein [Priestia megaterium]|uniref:hypothetical protein n=1 Tax=Priestia megaterium TaxID=1404 RepID=UPI0023DB0CA7|nr:hypothetical protein [Priestia megaterium]MDF2053160.1 hypothetical protein [Priestia megaterium]MDF2062552.1 hypothetical protein [Priestia megaterium]